jgi:hypothetical protein
MGHEDMDWFHQDQDRNPVKMVMNLRITLKAGRRVLLDS